MKGLFLTLIFSLVTLVSMKAQCTIEINAPTTAISNCIGPAITATHSGTGPISYIWNVTAPGSLSSSSSPSPTISSSTAGPVIVTVIAYDATFCTATDVDTINFVSPVDTFLIKSCTYPTTICPFDTPIMSLLSWNYIDGSGTTTGLTPDASNCIAADTAGFYQLLAIYETNCTVVHTYQVMDTCTSSGTCSIDAGPDLSVCNFTTVALNATVSPAGSGWTYSWTPGTNLSSTTVANPLFVSSTPGTYTYYVVGTNASLGCTVTDIITIEVYGYIDTFEVASCTYPYTLCPNDEADLMSFLGWTPAGTITGNCNIITAPGTFTFTGVYSGGCTVAHTYIVTDTCSSTGTCSIDAGPDLSVCNFTTVALNATVSPAGSGWTYSWTPGTNLSSTTVANPLFVSSTPGTYTYYVVGTNASLGCTVTDIITIEVYGYIDTFEVASCTYPYTLCPNDEADLMSFLGWTPAGTITGNCNIITAPGTFTFTGVYAGGCTVAHTYIVTDTCSTSGMPDMESINSIQLFPNPTTDQFNVQSEDPIQSIDVYSAVGELLLSKNNLSDTNHTISLEALSAGTYLVKIQTTKKGYAVKRLVKLSK